MGRKEGSQNYLVIIRRISAGLKISFAVWHIRQNVKEDDDNDNDEA